MREEKSFSQRAFSIYTDIRKLQDKAQTSYTLSTRRLRFGYEQQFARSTLRTCFEMIREEHAVERELQLCGYFCIITSEKMSASQALIQYKGRDISEKLFQSDKTFIGSKSERVQSLQSMSSKIFIEFVALIIRNRIYNLLKEQMIRMETKQKYMTVSAAIRELEKIEMVRRNGRHYKLDHAVTRTQKLILNSFGLDETDIKKRAEEYGKLLNISQSYISKEAQDNGEEEDD